MLGVRTADTKIDDERNTMSDHKETDNGEHAAFHWPTLLWRSWRLWRFSKKA